MPRRWLGGGTSAVRLSVSAQNCQARRGHSFLRPLPVTRKTEPLQDAHGVDSRNREDLAHQVQALFLKHEKSTGGDQCKADGMVHGE